MIRILYNVFGLFEKKFNDAKTFEVKNYKGESKKV